MIISLAIQSTYQSIELGLFFDGNLRVSVQEHKNNASKNIIPIIGSLLAEEKITLSDLTYIAVNQGPGPYTTLRVVIATANGLAYATQKPIVGVNAFSAFAHEIDSDTTPTYILFDAFNKDVYYAQVLEKKITMSGSCSIDELFERIAIKKDASIRFFGNGCTVYAEKLGLLYPNSILITNKEYPDLSSVAAIAHELMVTDPSACKQQISPLYLKEQKYKNQMGVMTAL